VQNKLYAHSFANISIASTTCTSCPEEWQVA